jgi:hypothetical protein
MYVELQGPFTVENWYKTLRSGRSFVTNGPLLFFNVKASGGSLRGSVEAIARDPLDRIEIIGNGTILKTITPAVNSRRWKEPVNLDTRKHSWVAARCYVKNDATVRFAHTSPVYLPGIWDARADAQYFVAWIDELISLSTQDPKRFASEAERDEVIGLYRQARDFYSRK